MQIRDNFQIKLFVQIIIMMFSAAAIQFYCCFQWRSEMTTVFGMDWYLRLVLFYEMYIKLWELTVKGRSLTIRHKYRDLEEWS